MSLERSRLLAADILRLGLLGLRGRPLRAALSATGIAIGIAAVVAVLGISASSQAALLAQIDALGTNLLTVTPGQTLTGAAAVLPPAAPTMVGAIDGVHRVGWTGAVDGAVYANPHVPAEDTNGITVEATGLDLPGVVDAPIRSGAWHSAASSNFPTVVLGATAAQRLGIAGLQSSPQIWLAGRYWTVIGILGPVTLAPELDAAALVGEPAAVRYLGYQQTRTAVYERSTDAAVNRVRAVLAGTADPAHPEQVQVSRPSDALVARATAKATFTNLFLGLGAVALLVGGVGIANVMVISVLERRSEIGLRRAIGAKRRHVRLQFLSEALLLTGLGGLAGVAAGAGITLGYAQLRGWTTTVPVGALGGSLLACLLVGTVAGLYPAERAARVSPTTALHVV
jgi:putative ABC transport system permease protein